MIREYISGVIFSDCEGATQSLCFVQYQFDETEHVSSILTHGNRKSGNKPYIRTEKSIERIKEEPVEAKPRHTFDNISKERGGVLSTTSVSTLPRDRKQVAYLKPRVKQNKCTNIDLTAKHNPFLALTVKCKEEEESGNPYIRRVVTSPGPSVVLASNNQLDDIAKFCTGDTEFSVLQVDPTYDLGEFSITAFT